MLSFVFVVVSIVILLGIYEFWNSSSSWDYLIAGHCFSCILFEVSGRFIGERIIARGFDGVCGAY